MSRKLGFSDRGFYGQGSSLDALLLEKTFSHSSQTPKILDDE